MVLYNPLGFSQAVGEIGPDQVQAYNKQTSQYLSKQADDLPDYSSPAATRPQTPAKGGGEESAKKGKGKKWKLEEVERWTMVKRIW